MKKMVIVNIENRWFNLIKNGEKTIEGRLTTTKYKTMKPNDVITFKSKNGETLYARVIYIAKYKSFEEMLTQHLHEALPGVEKLSDGIAIYREFYNEQQFNVSAIKIKVIQKSNIVYIILFICIMLFVAINFFKLFFCHSQNNEQKSKCNKTKYHYHHYCK